MPEGLESANIDPETGALAGDYCPLSTREWFRIGTAPQNQCEEHENGGFSTWLGGLEEELAERLARILKKWGRGRQ